MCYNLLFSFGCSGEPVLRYVSSLKYRFLWKIHSCTLYMLSYHVHYIFSFLLDVRANQSGGTWVPWSIDSFEKYTRTLYHICIISSHVRYNLLFSFGCSGEPAGGTWVPWSIDSFEKYTRVLYTICIISSHVRYNLLFSFGCSGEPVRRYVSSLKYRFLWKIHFV